MKSRLLAFLLLVALGASGCLARAHVYKVVTRPDGTTVTYNDRVLAALDSLNLAPEQRVEVVKALLEREKEGGERWRQAFDTLDQAAVIALLGTFIR